MKLAQANLPEVQQQWMIGDTEADIIAAQTYDVPVIGVLSGIRNQAQLEKYKPNQILPNLLSSITKILNP
jgi:phosphoglycolate phosphatase-like HAD superfamily hydrolase